MTTIAKDRTVHADGCRAARGLPGCDCMRVLFNDGAFCVMVSNSEAAIGKQDDAVISIARGHAYFDRIAEAVDRHTIEDLYNELAAAIA